MKASRQGKKVFQFKELLLILSTYINKIGRKQVQVLKIIREKPGMNNREIAEALNKPINTITPRVKELRDIKMVDEDGIKIDTRTIRMTHTWKAMGGS